MSWIIGAIIGVFGFATVLGLGWYHEVSLITTMLRAMLVLVVGLVLGRVIFGPLGIMLMKESAGHKPPAGVGPVDKEKEKEKQEEEPKPEPPKKVDKPEAKTPPAPEAPTGT